MKYVVGEIKGCVGRYRHVCTIVRHLFTNDFEKHALGIYVELGALLQFKLNGSRSTVFVNKVHPGKAAPDH